MSKLLEKIAKELEGVRVNEPVTVGGHDYHMHVLGKDEEEIAKGLDSGGGLTPLFAALADNSLATLAVAIDGVDDLTLDDLFPITDAPEERISTLKQDETALHQWQARELMNWLSNKPGTFVETLWFGYMGLKNKSRSLLEEIGPLSSRTPSGESKVMSSPEKGSLSATRV